MRFFKFAARRADAMEAAAIARYEHRRALSAAVVRAIRVADAMARLEAALRSEPSRSTGSRNQHSMPIPIPIPIDEPAHYGGGMRGPR